MAELFGLEVSKQTKLPEFEENKKLESFTPRVDDDGSLNVVAGSIFGQLIDIEGTIKNDSELITRYRNMADHPAVNSAVTAIVNEAIINEPEEETVKIDLANTKFGAGVKSKIEEEFDNILTLLNFEQNGYEIFRRWYIDGRLYYHAIIDNNKPADGVQEFRYVDPRKIRRIKEVALTPKNGTNVQLVKPVKDYYLFNEAGFTKDNQSQMQGTAGMGIDSIKIAKDAIVHVTSGLMDANGKSVVSYLHKAIVPLNKLNMLEQAVIIYRLSRAAERRVFSVDVSGMQPSKAEDYMSRLITNMKNKTVYDPTTGTVSDQRKFATMFEDIWLPNRDGKGTKVETLPGGENLGKMEDVEFFQQRLYQSLEVPISRLTNDDVYTLGRATEISREEISFEKFITRLRSRFSLVLLKCLRLQLLLKRIISPDDWETNMNLIALQYAKDNLFAELKNNEVMMARLGLLQMIEPYIGRYYSNEQIRSEVLKQTDEDIKKIDKQIDKEANDPQYLDPLGDDMTEGGGNGGGFNPGAPPGNGGPPGGNKPPFQQR